MILCTNKQNLIYYYFLVKNSKKCHTTEYSHFSILSGLDTVPKQQIQVSCLSQKHLNTINLYLCFTFFQPQRSVLLVLNNLRILYQGVILSHRCQPAQTMRLFGNILSTISSKTFRYENFLSDLRAICETSFFEWRNLLCSYL